MESLQAQLNELRNLPPTINPYSFLASKLSTQVLPDVAQSSIDQMYFLAAALGLIAFFALISLALRLSRKICWVFRYDSRLRLIQPHGAVSWALFSLFSIALLEVLIARYIQLWKGNPSSDTGFWIFTAWASVWVAGSIAIWSIGASLVLHLAATGHDVQNAAMFVNVAGIATPLIVTAVGIPLGVFGGRYYRNILLDYRTIQRNLADQAQSWTPGTGFNLVTLIPLGPTFQFLVDNVDKLATFAQSTYIFYSVATFVLGVALASVGGFFLVTLRRVLNRSNAMFTTTAKDEGHKRVKRSLNSLVLILVAFTLLDAGCFAVSVFGAIHPLTLSSSNVSTALTLSPLYLFTFLGLPCSILLVHGAYYAEGAVAVDKGTSHHSTFERKGTNNIISRATRRLGGGALEKEGRSGGVGGIESATVTVVVDVYVDEGVEEEGEEKEKSSSLDKIRL